MNVRRSVIALLVALAMVASACGSDEDAGDTTQPAPLATTTTAAPATTTTVPATTTTVATYDLDAAVLEYTSTIPEGWMAVGDITAFKDAVEASDALLIDVREVGEYEAGHLPGAINIPLRTVTDNLDKIPTDRQVFVYCKSGYRAGLAGSSLGLLGYDNVLIFPPGWNGWTAAEEEVSTEDVAAETYPVPDLQPEMLAAVDDFMNNIPEGYYTAGDVEAVKTAVDAGAFLLDIRTTAEYEAGFIPGAFNANLRALPASADEIPTDVPVIEYCKSGFRASLALPVLHVLGFDNARAFTGSYLAWTGADEPIETP
ncbi:MAG: rhodanese-like domain-containing protein [Acidimicrobiia bacterium]